MPSSEDLAQLLNTLTTQQLHELMLDGKFVLGGEWAFVDNTLTSALSVNKKAWPAMVCFVGSQKLAVVSKDGSAFQPC